MRQDLYIYGHEKNTIENVKKKCRTSKINSYSMSQTLNCMIIINSTYELKDLSSSVILSQEFVVWCQKTQQFNEKDMH